MQNLTVHPETKEQLKAVKAFLKALKIPFEIKPKPLPPHVLESINIGLKQIENGDTISFEEFKRKHHSR